MSAFDKGFAGKRWGLCRKEYVCLKHPDGMEEGAVWAQFMLAYLSLYLFLQRKNTKLSLFVQKK